MRGHFLLQASERHGREKRFIIQLTPTSSGGTGAPDNPLVLSRMSSKARFASLSSLGRSY